MFEQAAGLALVAALYPPAMLIAASYLASTRPGRTVLPYLVGGLVMVTLLGTAALIAIRAGGLSGVGQHASRNGLRLGIGVLALVAAVVIWRRRSKADAARSRTPDQANSGGGQAGAVAPGRESPGQQVGPGHVMPDPEDSGRPEPANAKKPGIVARLTSEPRPATAFVVGIFVFGPSVSFLAAVQVVGTSKASVLATVGAMAMIIVLALMFAWLPLVAYLAAPDRTLRWLNAFNSWLRRYRQPLMAGAAGVIGIILTMQGAVGLVL